MEQGMCGGAKFALGMMSGMVAGVAVGMTMAPSRRQVKKVAHQAAKKVTDAVEGLAEAMDL